MAKRTRGIVFLVVGPSGAGKDSLIEYAKTRVLGSPEFLFPMRCITRSSGQPGEAYISVSDDEFRAYLEAKEFALHWEAHGLRYAVGKEIEAWLKKGGHVIVNVSRSVVDVARRSFARVVVLEIQASRETLERRLKCRQRELGHEIKARLDRSSMVSVSGTDVVTIRNDGPIETAGEIFLATIKRFAHGK